MEDVKAPMMERIIGPAPCATRVWDDLNEKYGWSRPSVLCDGKNCDRCAWNLEEAYRRAQIPLTVCPDGLRRKLIPPRPTVLKENETEEQSDE